MSEKPDFRKMTSVEAVVEACPQRVSLLLEALDLSRPGMEDVKRALDAGDQVRASGALVSYYRAASTAGWLRKPHPAPDEKTLNQAELVLKDTCTFYDQTDRVPRRKDGGLDWEYKGPTHDIEWAWALNRHFHIDWMFQAYLQTKRREFVDTIDQHLRDWVVDSAPYPGVRNGTEKWRELEVGLRTKVWGTVFFGLQSDDRFSPGTRLLMLSSIPEHAHCLRNFHGGANHATMELSALALIGAAWPEFKQSSEWLDYSKETLTSEIQKQVYPDGADYELTSSYHWVAMDYFGQLAEVCRNAGEPVPEAYSKALESMHNYLAYSLCQDGTGPLNNDSDHKDYTQLLLQAAKLYHRPDWVYIASTGSRGEKPKGQPSKMFEWAGQLVSRSGWEAEDHWSFFDIGPWGAAHQHNDRLHLSLHAYGRDLLVDSGRFSYAGEVAERFRGYAVGAQGHNVILIDGHGQGPGEVLADRALEGSEYLIDPAFDYARGSFSNFDSIEGKVTHTRAMLYVRGKCWVVIDRVVTDRPRDLEALWHFHPDCTLTLSKDNSVLTSDVEQGNLGIFSSGPESWKIEIVRGQDKPHPQGWYSDRYNLVAPASTAICRTDIDANAIFGWLLLPSYCAVPPAHLNMKRNGDAVNVEVGIDGKRLQASIPLSGERRPSLTI